MLIPPGLDKHDADSAARTSHPRPDGRTAAGELDRVETRSSRSVASRCSTTSETRARTLQDILSDKKSTLPDATVQSMLDTLVGRRQRASPQHEIALAQAAGADPKGLAHAQDELAKGQAELAKGRADVAVDHFRQAWQQAQDASTNP